MHVSYSRAREILGVSGRTMSQMIRNGRLQSIETEEGSLVFDHEELDLTVTRMNVESLRKAAKDPLYRADDEFFCEEEVDEVSTRAPIRVKIGQTEEDCPVRARFFRALASKRALV